MAKPALPPLSVKPWDAKLTTKRPLDSVNSPSLKTWA